MKGKKATEITVSKTRPISTAKGWVISTAAKMALLGMLCVLAVFSRQAAASFKPEFAEGNENPPLYLPSGPYAKLSSLGFDNFLSDVILFHTLNYFGKKLAGDKDYRWLYSMCESITSLDPKKKGVFEFCGTLLAWEAKEFEKSNAIYTRAIESFPLSWRFRYLRGFNYWYFLERQDLARLDMQKASELPEAPAFISSIASRLLVEENKLETAIEFLKASIQSASDPHSKASLIDKLKRALLTRDLEILNTVAIDYKRIYGSFPEDPAVLVEKGLLSGVPKEPFGGRYYFDPSLEKAQTSSGKKGLFFKGKTARTGIMKEEFK